MIQLALLSMGFRSDITEADALRIAEQSIRRVCTVSRQLADTTENEQALQKDLALLKVERDAGRNHPWWDVSSNRYSVTINYLTGQVMYVSYQAPKHSETWEDALAISDERVLQIAQEYYRAIGGTLQLKLRAKHKLEGANGGNWWGATVEPTWRGVSFVDNWRYELDHQTGIARMIAGFDLPDPPANMTPAFGLAAAKSSAMAKVFSMRNANALLEPEQGELFIWKPSQHLASFYSELTQADLAEGQQNRGRLVYRVMFENAELRDKIYPIHYFGKVDARDGRVLELIDSTGMVGGGPAAKPAKGISEVWKTWKSQKGPVALCAEGGKPLTTSSGALSSCSTPKRAFKGEQVYLSRGKLALKAEYDTGLGVLRIGNKDYSYAKPSADLKKLLGKVLSNQ